MWLIMLYRILFYCPNKIAYNNTVSVYTHITKNELQDFLIEYSVGELLDFSGVSEGATNTIYKVKLENGEFILTIFEELNFSELPFFIDLVDYLNSMGVNCAKIIADKNGERIKCLKNKAAIMSEFLLGATLSEPNIKQSQVTGKALAILHQVAIDFSAHRENPFTLNWHIDLAKQLLPHLPSEEMTLLERELYYQQRQDYSHLPKGIIHMDLFPDNVLFQGNQLSGLLDFYFACYDVLLLDLAVTMNAWSLTASGFNNMCAETILVHYQLQRQLTNAEIQQLTNVRRYAAVHFWLTRLRDYYLVPRQDGVVVKEPQQFSEMLKMLINS